MAPARRPTNGRSPLVNQQRQITSFFSKQTPKPNPNPNPNPSRSPSPSPNTPSPIDTKRSKKPPLLIPSPPLSLSSPDPAKKEVVNKRVRVYWPLDSSWYEGLVVSFDEASGKHLVRYDDDEEEMLDLSRERIEWVVMREKVVSRKFRRLRRVSVVVEDDDEDDDEDWGEKDLEVEEDDDLVDLEFENEDCDEGARSKGKRKVSGRELDEVGVGKKRKSKVGVEKSTVMNAVDMVGDKFVQPKVNVQWGLIQ